MQKVRFTFNKTDFSKVVLEYEVMDNVHSNLWVTSIQSFFAGSESPVTQIHNFGNRETEIEQQIKLCNQVIHHLNNLYEISIPAINRASLQSDIDKAHVFYIEMLRDYNGGEINELWELLNSSLLGLRVIDRRGKNKMQGQVFYFLPGSKNFSLPDESYNSFTTKKQFGYCYAGYPHLGMHLLEMYNKGSTSDNDVIPMHEIAGGGYLWFGNTTSWIHDVYRRFKIKRWFKKNQLDKVVGHSWGDPRLALGWLPVAKLITPVTSKDLVGLFELVSIEVLG